MPGADPATSAAPGALAAPAALAPPEPHHGADLWRIARAAGGLDVNSAYAYMLWCRDFAATSVVASTDGEPVGFVSAYRRPARPKCLFVWQVAVLPRWRRHGLALAMLDDLAHRQAQGIPVETVETTVTASNAASLRTFERFAERHGAGITQSVLFPQTSFPDAHEAEVLLTIGPIR